MYMYIVYHDIHVYIMHMHIKAQAQGHNDA